MYIPGTGLEDFETCERVFSQSNALASGICHASTFHHYQAIEEYFGFWDEEKYFMLGMFPQLFPHTIFLYPFELNLFTTTINKPSR